MDYKVGSFMLPALRGHVSQALAVAAAGCSAGAAGVLPVDHPSRIFRQGRAAEDRLLARIGFTPGLDPQDLI